MSSARGLSFEQTIRELVLAMLRFFDERRDLYRVHFELKFPGGRHPLCDVEDHGASPEKQIYIDRLTRYFEEHIANKADAPLLALFFSETVAAVLFRRIPETTGPRLEDDAEFLSDLLLQRTLRKKEVMIHLILAAALVVSQGPNPTVPVPAERSPCSAALERAFAALARRPCAPTTRSKRRKRSASPRSRWCCRASTSRAA